MFAGILVRQYLEGPALYIISRWIEAVSQQPQINKEDLPLMDRVAPYLANLELFYDIAESLVINSDTFLFQSLDDIEDEIIEKEFDIPDYCLDQYIGDSLTLNLIEAAVTSLESLLSLLLHLFKAIKSEDDVETLEYVQSLSVLNINFARNVSEIMYNREIPYEKVKDDYLSDLEIELQWSAVKQLQPVDIGNALNNEARNERLAKQKLKIADKILQGVFTNSFVGKLEKDLIPAEVYEKLSRAILNPISQQLLNNKRG